MQHSKPVRPSAESSRRSRTTLTLGVFVFAVIIGDIILIVIMSSANPRLYFTLETPYLYILLFSLFLAPILAIAGWKMTNTDLKKLRAGSVSLSVSKTTKLAKYLGVFGAFVSPIIALLGLLLLFSSARTEAVKDAMIQHLIKLGADAYQFRVRPASLEGGGGSYVGYTVPGHLSSDEYGIYTATAIRRDSARFNAEATLGFPGQISVTIDSTGTPREPWMFTGHFQLPHRR